MSKYIFRNNQRYAVYKAFQGRCQWCREPVDFKNFHIDHVLPEELLNDPVRMEKVLLTYGLDGNFNINNYENWIPAHTYCNQWKSDKVYEGLPLIKTILDYCAKNKELEQRIEYRLNREPQKADLLASVQNAIEINLINLQELQNFILKTDIMDSDDEDLNQISRELEQKVEYQTEKVIAGLMDMLRKHAIDVIKSICSALGSDWTTFVSVLSQAKDESPYAIAYPIKNNIDSSLQTLVVVSPSVVNKQLIIKFKNEGKVIDEHSYDLVSGIDYQTFRESLRHHYKSGIAAKLR